MKLKPYPKYKDSGVPWLGEIPTHWDVIRNGYLFQEVVDTNHPELDLLSIMMDRGIILQSESGRKTRASEDRSTYKRIQSGQLGYNLMNAFMGSIGISNYEGILSPAYAVGKPRLEMESRYFHYLFRTPIYLEVFDSYSYGIMYERNRLYYERFKLIYSPFPPVEEQKAIVEYIKFISHKINRFIRNKRSLIKLLNEQKQVIINQAVTRGFNSTSDLISSNTSYFGYVPKTWKLKRFKNVCKLQRGVDLAQEQFIEGKFPVYGSNGIIGYHNSFTTKAPCITVGRSGSVGEVNYIEENFWAHNTTLFVLKNFNNNWYFLFYLLKNIELKTLSGGSAVPTLNRNYIHRIYVAVPSVVEQEKIVTHIEEQTRTINRAIERTQHEIDLIQEYRTRLISDVVTGKIDVRDIEISALPDEDVVEDLEDEELLDAAEAELEAVEDADE